MSVSQDFQDCNMQVDTIKNQLHNVADSDENDVKLTCIIRKMDALGFGALFFKQSCPCSLLGRQLCQYRNF